MRISLSGITGDSIVDGPGLRLTIFTQGCLHHCPGCHNPQTHDPEGGSRKSPTGRDYPFGRRPLFTACPLPCLGGGCA